MDVPNRMKNNGLNLTIVDTKDLFLELLEVPVTIPVLAFDCGFSIVLFLAVTIRGRINGTICGRIVLILNYLRKFRGCSLQIFEAKGH